MFKWFIVLFAFSCLTQAQCTLYQDNTPLTKPWSDPLYSLLTDSDICPSSINELTQLIHEAGLKIQTSMVANRGRNNPTKGSFSFFTSVSGQLNYGRQIKPGDFFLGYFTRLKKNQIILDQDVAPDKLLIEAIAWDKQKQLYHFYELRGMKKGQTRWFYRGDSMDAYKDNQWLYRQSPKGESHFGKRMRCSACHNSGGPILKELTAPHNDWWRKKRPLILQPNKPDDTVAELIVSLSDADLLAHDVRQGAKKLVHSPVMNKFKRRLSLQEQLRPLFCTTEINLESSYHSKEQVALPSAFFINPLLGRARFSLSVARYEQLTEELGVSFPETRLVDADHKWLAPVKSAVDLQAIKSLIKQDIITQQFAEAVLMVDFAHPLFSAKRCALLQLIPTQNDHWLELFVKNLNEHSRALKGASELSQYLNNGTTHEEFMRTIRFYTYYLRHSFSLYIGARREYCQLIKQRRKVGLSELSSNPLGQILEPGFRVIFPEGKRCR